MIEGTFFVWGVIATGILFAIGCAYAERARRNDYCRGATKHIEKNNAGGHMAIIRYPNETTLQKILSMTGHRVAHMVHDPSLADGTCEVTIGTDRHTVDFNKEEPADSVPGRKTRGTDNIISLFR